MVIVEFQCISLYINYRDARYNAKHPENIFRIEPAVNLHKIFALFQSKNDRS